MKTNSNTGATCFMYIGNLERYQGIDLLLKSFGMLLRRSILAVLLVIGGAEMDIDEYEKINQQNGLSGYVRFLGPRPVAHMGEYFSLADVLISPRLDGVNTPMKIYSYLNSGKAILATDIPAHTQVLTPETALLKPPEPEAFAEGMVLLATNPALRSKLAENALTMAHDKYSKDAYDRTVSQFCHQVEIAIGKTA